jgi:hypothetical protein
MTSSRENFSDYFSSFVTNPAHVISRIGDGRTTHLCSH